MLFYEAKKNTDLQEIIANVDDMSDDEISQVKTKLPWMKKALRQLKSKNEYAKISANSDSYFIDITPKYVIDGAIYRWISSEKFVTFGRGSQLLVNTGKLLFFPDRGGMWFDTAFNNHVSENLLINLQFIKRGNRSDYIAMYREDLQYQYRGDNLPILVDHSKQSSSSSMRSPPPALSALGVRFS